MPDARTITRVFRSQPTIEGAGVHLKRAFGFYHTELTDPFLLFDDFRSQRPEDYLPGFPWHPHRGIETITYVLEGRVEHGDSMKNQGTIAPGDVQWMTAGSGIIHQEMPKGDAKGRMGGFQLWANLPARQKMMDPRYRDVKAADIPEVKAVGGTTIKIIAGTVGEVRGPARDIIIDPEYLDISVPAGVDFVHNVKPGHTALAYVIAGDGYFDRVRDSYSYERTGINYFDFERSCLIGSENMILFSDGDRIETTGGKSGCRFLFFSGQPLREPVAWAGPIVMNTQAELRQAFEEYEKGTFLKHV